jgi:tRNA/tmRNA/rRNA uracil-C5-methylase (TrmA/RlmC/RlmD family)
LITRVYNSLKATDTTIQVDQSARTIVRKLQGRRASAKITEEEKKALEAEGKEVNQISASQMSFDNRIENFDKLIMLLSSVPLYNPNEEELKIETLKALYSQLKEKNTEVILPIVQLSNSRISRNKILYKENTGLVDTALDSKTYIKSVFGATSPQYKQVSRLYFKNRE